MAEPDIELIVQKLSEMQLIRPGKITGNWYTIHCPFHSDGNEKKPSFGMSIHDEYRNGRMYKAGTCNCFACGYKGSLIKTVNELLEIKHVGKSGLEWLKENIPNFDDTKIDFDYLIEPEVIGTLDAKYAANYMLNILKKNEVKYVPEEELASYRYTVDYMYQRHLTDKAIAEYDIGFDPKFVPPGKVKPVPCITMPVRDESMRTLFLCRRAINSKMFNYPEGVTKPLYGFELIPKGCKSLCIAESCLDAISIHIFGYHAVALMGTGNEYQIDQLKRSGIREFVLCLDGDEAGRKAAEKLKRRLKSVGIVWTVHIDPEKKDANNCTKEEFDLYYSQRE